MWGSTRTSIRSLTDDTELDHCWVLVLTTLSYHAVPYKMASHIDDKKIDYSHNEYTNGDKPGSPTSQLDQSPLDAARIKPGMTSEEKQAAMAAASALDPGVAYSDPRFWYFMFTVITVCLCGGGKQFPLRPLCHDWTDAP